MVVLLNSKYSMIANTCDARLVAGSKSQKDEVKDKKKSKCYGAKADPMKCDA